MIPKVLSLKLPLDSKLLDLAKQQDPRVLSLAWTPLKVLDLKLLPDPRQLDLTWLSNSRF